MNGNGGRAIQGLIALVIGVIGIGFLTVQGCTRGPFGRRQLVSLSQQQQSALGAQAYAEVLQGATVIESGPAVEDVDEVTRRLVRATSDPEFMRITSIPERPYRWEAKLVRSKEVNAFCLPGGKMVVYTAILPVCETDAGLATVMGHEIAHALAQHGAERMAQARIAQLGTIAAAGALGSSDPQKRRRLLVLMNAGAQFGILKYDRSHESEADHVGLLLMAAAGYDPQESVRFWERMRKVSGGGRVPEFVSTHPSHETRIRDLVNWIPQAMPLYRAARNREPAKKLDLVR